MALHRLTAITVGVPDVVAVAGFYADFGLAPVEAGAETSTPEGARFSTADGGQQLTLVPSPRRRLIEIGLGAEDADDLGRIARELERRAHPFAAGEGELVTREPAAGLTVRITVAEAIVQTGVPSPATNGPGRIERLDARADCIGREAHVVPRKLGHVVVGSTDQSATRSFFTDAIGFKVSDELPGLASFLRCSTDHHNLLVQAAPIDFLHHTAWQVDDVDEVGRGASAMLEKDPGRHAWGLGRHHIGSNFFWYLRDPAGNFAEYYSDLDCIVDDELWEPGVFDGPRGLYNWGPIPPPDFVAPADIVPAVQ